MIRKGLKKGDKFEDGGRIFVVEEVLETGNYLSREIKEEIEEVEETPAEEEAPAEEEEKQEEAVKEAPKKTRTKKTKEA